MREICSERDEAPARNGISVRHERARDISGNRWSAREDFIKREVGSLDPFTQSDFRSARDTFEKCGAQREREEGRKEGRKEGRERGKTTGKRRQGKRRKRKGKGSSRVSAVMPPEW